MPAESFFCLLQLLLGLYPSSEFPFCLFPKGSTALQVRKCVLMGQVLKNAQTIATSETKYRIPSDQAIPTNCPLFSLLASPLHFQTLAFSIRHTISTDNCPLCQSHCTHSTNSLPDTLFPLSPIVAAWKQGQQRPSFSHCLATRFAWFYRKQNSTASQW